MAAEPTFGVGLFRHRRVRCPGPVACDKPCNRVCAALECFCLQYRVFDEPFSNYDYWHGLYYPDGCGGDDEVEHYEDDEYAYYPQDAPQHCMGDPPRCLGQGSMTRSFVTVPGYKSLPKPLSLPNQASAAKALTDGMSAAGRTPITPVEFYKIRTYKVTHTAAETTSTQYIYVAVAKWKLENEAADLGISPAGVPCFGLQMDNTQDEVFVELNNKNCQHATAHRPDDKQIRIIFEAPGGEDRVATILLE